jgi:hypothetical protein
MPGVERSSELLGAMGAFDLSLHRMGFNMGFDVGLMLEGGHHCEEVGYGRVSVRPNHAHQAFLGDAGFLAQRCEADGCVDAVAQEDEAGRDFAVEERLQRLLQKSGFEVGVALGARHHRMPNRILSQSAEAGSLASSSHYSIAHRLAGQASKSADLALKSALRLPPLPTDAGGHLNV